METKITVEIPFETVREILAEEIIKKKCYTKPDTINMTYKDGTFKVTLVYED